MIATHAHDRLRGALRAELNRHYGRIGEIEQGLDRAEGYLGKYCRGELSIPVDVFLKSLELLEIEPGQFFNRALGAPLDSSVYLREVMASESEKSLARMEKVATEILLDIDPASGHIEESSPEVDLKAEELAEGIVVCAPIEQRRRLRLTRKYRSAAFVRSYTKKLLVLSYSDPKAAAKNAEVVGADLIPMLEDSAPRERLELVLRVMMTWAFARRVTDSFQQAAAAVHFALDLAARYRFEKLSAELLKTGAYVLSDLGKFREALKLLNEAVIVFDDLEETIEVSKVHVQRAGYHLDTGETRAAIRVLKKALRGLPKDEPSLAVYRMASFQYLAMAHEADGCLAEAEHWLLQALDSLDEGQRINHAKLLWQAAMLADKRGEISLAEARLREALDTLIECEASECTLAALDLTRVLLKLNRAREAVELARGMAHLISASRNSPIDQATLVEFVRAAIEGELTIAVVDHLERGIRERAQAPQRRKK